ncbi:MAG: hypothetical protein CRN43_13345, partial [Candidatus Nephrothrix sp. EaCA]
TANTKLLCFTAFSLMSLIINLFFDSDFGAADFRFVISAKGNGTANQLHERNFANSGVKKNTRLHLIKKPDRDFCAMRVNH